MPGKKKGGAIQRSPAEFFAENKSIAGFDNPGKSTYTTVREFVENALDATEENGIFPDISIKIERVPTSVARPDLYKRKSSTADADAGGGSAASAKGKAKTKTQQYYRVTVRDNGVGMRHDDVPDMFGRVLSGTKYGVKQARGRFGLGAKMALIWSKMTTAGELQIFTAQPKRAKVTECRLDIDLHKNEPKILKHVQHANDGTLESEHAGKFPPGWHGAEVSVMFEGNWLGGVGKGYRHEIITYMRQLAVITPYAEFTLHYLDTIDSGKDLRVRFARRPGLRIPDAPTLQKHHPSSINLTKLEELARIAQAKHSDCALKKFLKDSFSFMYGQQLETVLCELGSKFFSEQEIGDLTQKMWMHLQKTLQSLSWPDPDGDCLSPAGAYGLYLGIQKEFRPELIVTHSEKAAVFEGHSFIVEAAVSLGGKSIRPGINVIRFANRIPLVFEPGADVITKTANEIKWGNYKINNKEDKVGVYVSIVSTKIPFKGTGKEYISNDVREIKDVVEKAIKACGTQLKAKIAKKQKEKDQASRRKELEKYIKGVCSSIFNVVKESAEDHRDAPDEPLPKRAKISETEVEAEAAVAEKVLQGDVTKGMLERKLQAHIEKYDAKENMEYMAEQGRHVEALASDDLFIAPIDPTSASRQTLKFGIPAIGSTFSLNQEELAFDAAQFASSHNGHNGIEDNMKSGSAPLTLLPQDKGDESPACLDGSKYGFYFNPSTTGSTKWTISIEGGGWCYDEQECFSRSKMKLGSSTSWAPSAGCGCMNVKEDGSGMDDCNCIYMPYGDGASFSGFRKEVWPVPGGGNLTFRGIKNLDATIEWAIAHGLDKASEFVLTGGSAGGLSTFLHSDRVAAKVQAAAPACKKILAAPVVGYFLDHDNFGHTTGVPNTPTWNQANYTTWMKYIYTMQNLTFGADGGLTEACETKHPDEPGLCFMSPHMQDTIKTPFFMFNSKYDAWQLGNEFQSKWSTPAEKAGVLQYGVDFLKQFAPVQAEPKNGAMITSCICHGCDWATLKVNGMTSYQHYANWYYGKTTGAESIHIDTAFPNGNGTFTDPRCSPFK